MSCGESDPEKSHLEVESDSEIKEKVSDKKNLGKILRSNAPQIETRPTTTTIHNLIRQIRAIR